MNKLKIFKTFCVTLTICAFGFAASNSAVADPVSAAGQIPAGYGYTHGRIPVARTSGAPQIHDQNLMRYDKNSKLSKDGFKEYQQYGYGVNPDASNQKQEQED